MDSGEGGGGDGGGGEERDADLSPQALSLPLLTRAVIPEQGSSSHTSAMAPAKEPLTLPQQEEEGAEGSQAREETQGGEQKEGGRLSQENGACQKQGMKEDFGEGYLSGQRKEEGEVHVGVGEASVTGGLPEALSSRGGEEEKEEEEAISNQSQTKSKCSLLPQQSQHSSSSSTAKASGTLDSKIAASPKPSPTPSTSPKPSPFLSTSPKHFTSPSSSSALLSETEVKDIKGDQGWISGFPQSFKSQQSTLAFPLAGTEPASTPAEDDGPAGVPHSSISNGDGAKAPEPNDSQLDMEVDDERDKEGEQKEAVLKNLNQELSPNSLTSHMTIMHSRNSCKTLKCPKCNWHYKSQHTLQVHMKEKHPETGGQCVCGTPGGKCVCGGATRGVCGYCSSGKPHPRLARGETYACGYKPYRCEVCDYATSSKGNLSIHMQSDKHLNNVQNGGHSNGHMHTSHTTNNSSSSNGHTVDEPAYKLPLSIPTPTTQPAKLTPPAHSHSHGKRWRCDVCDYETSIARNLRIHTTSEKHTHNMLRLQRGYYLSHCRSLAPQLKHLQNTGAELSLSMRLTGQQVTEQPVTLGSTLTPSPSPSPSPPPAPSLSPTGPLSQGVFQCLVCSCFSSDSLESVEQHLNAPRSLAQSEWCSLVAGGCHCRLCGYTTPLRANFSLHCQTDRHRTRYQLAAHLQEGGDRGQEGAALIAKGNPVQLRCNLCDYVTSSLEKLRGHSLSSHHEASVRVYRFLQQYDGEVDGGSWLFHCLLCNHSSSSKLQVLKHSQTPTHQQREGLLQLQPMGGEELAAIFTIRKSPDGVTGELSEDMETSSETTTGPLETTKDTCNLGAKQISEETEETRGEEREKREPLPSVKRPSSGCGEMENSISTKRPRIHQQNENQQTVQCPLCQVKLPYTHLRQHLTHVHSVAQDCVDKLISAVTPSMEQPQPQLETELQTDSCTDDIQKNKIAKNNNANSSHTADSVASVDSQKNKGISVANTEGDVAAPKDVTALLTPPLEDNTTHPSNGRLAPQSPTQIPPSSPPTSPPSDPPSLSDRHGYRFRCSRRALQDSGAGVAAPEAPRGPDPRPYRCKLCGVGYSQSSTLDIHLRSVLHQTRARAAQNPAPQTPASTVAVPVSVSTTATQPNTTREEISKSLPFTKRPDVVSSSASSLLGPGLAAEAQPTLSNPTDSQQAKRRVAELLASRNQLMLIQQQQLAQAQAQAQAQLQQHTALLQSQVIQHLPLGPDNLLKQHFPLTPDNLLSLQQQLLLPFYLSGDMKLDMSPELGQLISANSIPKEHVKAEAKNEFPAQGDEKQTPRQSSNSAVNQPKDHVHCEAKVETACSNSCPEKEKEEMQVPSVKNESQKEETDSSSFNLHGQQCPPPRVPYAAANGEPLRALLQSYGYELALQYTQSRHRHQQQIATQMTPDKPDLNQMEVCLEKERYELSELKDGKIEGCNKDKEAPIPGTSASATSQTTSPAKSIPLPLPKIPMLPLSLPQLPIPSLPLPKLPLPPIPFPMELPLLSPVVMQSVALQSQPWLDTSMNPELAKLYQSQLNPALLGQQPQVSPALLAPQSQLSPALLSQPPQLNPALLGQPSQPSPVQTGLQPQVSPTTLDQQQGKRTRTRISEEQLTVLRRHFDINSLPSDEEINKMSAMSGLPHKVIKHWFRNTLFKERQRDKDSPYNFNNPPTTALEECREEVAQNQALTLSPCSLSPGLPANISPQSQTTDLQRGEPHRGRRSSRTRFTEQQLETLQGVFEATPYPREEEYDRLSALLSLPNRVIVVWFQNARQRARKNQDRGTDEGLEGKSHLDNIHRPRNGCLKNDDDNEDNSCGDDGQGDSQNENSMDLTYEYYTHPDSPVLDSSTNCTESEHQIAKGEPTPVTGKQEDKTIPPQADKSPALVQTQNGISDADIQRKEIVPAMKTGSSLQPEPKLQPESTPERSQPCSSSYSQKTLHAIPSMSHSSQGHTHSPPSDQTLEKPVQSPNPSPSLPSAPESETSHAWLPDATSGLSAETQPQNQLQLQTQAQFQCSLCPVSLPSFQLWQEHQTRHLLAAQSQVQLLHSGFTDRTMPYMMLHPNHTLMASQMLSGAMSQMHPNPTHPMVSHLNSMQLKNALSDHSSNVLTSLSQSSLTPMKQSAKLISETGMEGQRGGREVEEEHRRDKRQRTTITPEQLEVLYQRYSLDSNPTRGVLESIARDVGLTRRVVQVWFQNTRARERKGQFRSMGPGSSFSLGLNHLRCPFCRALFKVKSALDAHMRSRHWAEAERAGYNLSTSNGSSGQIGMAMSSVMDRPGPSVSSNPIPNLGYVISNKELTVKPPVTSLSSTMDLNNPEEDDDYEEDDEEYPCEEGSSMADQDSLSPEGSGGPSSDWGETQTLQQHHHHQQQRQRTQMSHFQILQLRDFYRSHRTPNRHECEALGQELGLPHRVVQVWFQNARAKEKRARSLSSDSAEREQAELSAGAGERDRA
ncbi:zinc finger homeobox protein 3-like protein [Lates japonicus]|uniref:Zinc finger homeobox protein 3-like protein n=1 Tax=Lates japonicus TaxID=270547 RepID=A0AAD3NAM5_LATJO|nr:zinc finger homeobox protein 3-like protein [Lates japonicus]